MQSYGDKIRYAMKKAGKKSGQVAEHIGVSQAMVSKVLNNKSEFLPDNLKKFAEFVDTPIDFFIKNNYVSLETIKLEGEIKSILEDSNSADFMVVLNTAKKADISPAELSQAINFILEMKKRTGSN